MSYSPPVILKECIPLAASDQLIDSALKRAADSWHQVQSEQGHLPIWDMDFALQNATVVSRSMLYDLSGEDVYVAMAGDQCREFIGLEKTKGLLKDLIPAVNVGDILHRLAHCAEQRAPNYCFKSMSWNHGRDFMHYEALFLPFTDKGSVDCSWVFVPMAFHLKDELET